MLDPNVTAWMDQGFHCGMTQGADGVDAQFGCCFNCLEEGHRWRDCKNTSLLPELQEILDIKQEGGAGNKGGHAPMNPRNGKGKVATPTKPAQ